MPKPFQDLEYQKFMNMSVDKMKEHLFKPAMPPTELTLNSKVAELSHFLVQNCREHVSPEEHVIDTAIKCLKYWQDMSIKYMELKADYDMLNEKYQLLSSDKNDKRSVATEVPSSNSADTIEKENYEYERGNE